MKKVILLLFFNSTLFHEIDGQFSIGLSGGINLANSKFVDFDYIDPKITMYYFAGITPGYKLSTKISFISDIQYSQKGYKIENGGNLSGSKFRYTYLDILPQVEYQIHNNVGVGVGFNFGIRVEEEQKIGEEDWQSTKEYEVVKSFDYGVVGSIKGHCNNFSPFIRYNYGLKDITNIFFTDINGQTIQDVKQKNSNIQVGVGYTIKLDKK